MAQNIVVASPIFLAGFLLAFDPLDIEIRKRLLLPCLQLSRGVIQGTVVGAGPLRMYDVPVGAQTYHIVYFLQPALGVVGLGVVPFVFSRIAVTSGTVVAT